MRRSRGGRSPAIPGRENGGNVVRRKFAAPHGHKQAHAVAHHLLEKAVGLKAPGQQKATLEQAVAFARNRLSPQDINRTLEELRRL